MGVGVGGSEVEPIDELELRCDRERLLRKGEPAFEDMEADPLHQVAEGHVPVLGQRLQDLEKPLFETDAGLHSFHGDARYLDILVHWYNRNAATASLTMATLRTKSRAGA